MVEDLRCGNLVRLHNVVILEKGRVKFYIHEKNKGRKKTEFDE